MLPAKECSTVLRDRVCIGTVQFGMRYGVANTSGQPDPSTVSSLLKYCASVDLLHFDTAEAYGESESVLGNAFHSLELLDRVKIITKGTFQSGKHNSLTDKIHHSLQTLKVPKLQGWLLHDEKQIDLWNHVLADEAARLISSSLVGHFGLSCYEPSFALRGLEETGLSLLQFPANPFDRRFLRHETLQRLAACKAGMFVRSIYLQGLCLMAPEEISPLIPHAKRAVSVLSKFCQERELQRDFFCFHYVLHRTHSLQARLVIGVDSMAQLKRTCALAALTPPASYFFDEWDALWPEDIAELVLPYRWPKQIKA